MELRPPGQREHERRVARAGTRDRVAQPASDQLVDERLNRRVGPVDRLHGARRYPDRHHLGRCRRRSCSSRASCSPRAPGASWPTSSTRRPPCSTTASTPSRAAWRRSPRPGRVRCWSATRSAAGWRCAPRCATRLATRGLVTVGATAGIEDDADTGGTRRGRRPACVLDRGGADRGRRRHLGAPAAVRRPVRDAHRSPAGRAAWRRTPSSWRRCCAPPARACSSRSGTSCSRSSSRCSLSRASRDEGYTSAARKIARDRPTAKAAIVADAGHAAHLQQPDEVGALICCVSLDLDARQSSSSAPRHPAPVPPAPSASRRAAPAARARAASRTAPASPARRPAAGPPRRPAATRRRCPRARRACSTGTASSPLRARQPQRLAGGAEAARAASFTLTTSQASSSTARRTARAGDRLVRRDRRGHSPAHLAQLLEAAAGCSTNSMSKRSSARISRDRLLDRPGAVRVHPQRGPGADRLAHRRDALLVLGQADLHLEARVARAHALARPLGHLGRRPAGRVRLTGRRVARRLRQRAFLLARLEVQAGDLLRRRAPAGAAVRRRR